MRSPIQMSRLLSTTITCTLLTVIQLVAAEPQQTSSVITGLSESKPDSSNLTVQVKSANVRIGVYIESLCPDSRRFFAEQLVPVNRQLKYFYLAQIVPFGHARCLGNNKMICQHGARECDGNRKMACVLARAQDQTEAIETLGCMFESLDNWRECVKTNMPGLKSIDEIETCSKGDESYQLMLKAEQETGRVGYVPHLTLNGKNDANIQNKLEHELKKSICHEYRDAPRPEACRGLALN